MNKTHVQKYLHIYKNIRDMATVSILFDVFTCQKVKEIRENMKKKVNSVFTEVRV